MSEQLAFFILVTVTVACIALAGWSVLSLIRTFAQKWKVRAGDE